MATVTLQNLSRPGSLDFYAGERWAARITGATPGGTVSCQVVQSGSETTYGTTDADGNFLMIGTMGREDVGLWTEIWKVNGVQVLPSIQFRVRPVRVNPSELPFEIPESNWEHAAAHTPIDKVLFTSDDLTVRAMPMDIVLGKVIVGGRAAPWNTMSSAVGSQLPARRRVYAY